MNTLDVIPSSATTRWLVMAALLAIATGVNFWIQPLTADRAPLLPFFPAMLAIGFLCGLAPAIAGLGLSVLAVNVFWIQPTGGLDVLRETDAALLLLYMGGASLAITLAVYARHLVQQSRRTREQLHQALQASRSAQRRFEVALSGSRIIAWECDAELRYTWLYNPHPSFAPQDFIGKRMGEVAPGGEVSEFHAAAARVFASGRGERVPVAWRREGATRHYLSHIDPLKDEAGRVVGLVGASVDVTELRRAESRARRLAAVLEGTPDFVAIAGADGAVRYINPAGRRLLGIPEDADVATLAHQQLCPPWVVEKTREVWLPQALRDGSSAGEGALLTRDGREIPVSFVLLAERDAGGALASVSTIARDISSRRALQEELQREIRRKDEFLATLAHELRNPMAPIRYAAATLREGMTPGALLQARQTIERQSAHMAHLLDDLLDMSRVTRDVIELERERLDLRDVAQQAIEAAKPLLQEQQHRLVVSLPPDALPVDGDRTRLVQVLGIVLENAAKYTEPGGRIELCLEAEGQEALAHVDDTGIGLAPEMLPQVFDLFSQANPGQKMAKGGLGIGLALARRLAQMHGGAIEAKSEGLGCGSRFTLRLPLAIASAPATPQAQPPPDHTSGDDNVIDLYTGKPRILVVDDNRDAAESLALLLRGEGYTTHVAYDGGSALLAYRDTQPDVVLLDIGLPDMSGAEVAREMRSQGDARTRLVAITGWSQDKDRERTRAAGFDQHLVKPVDPEALLAMLARVAPAPGARERASH